ncbi:MAG: sodium-dependent transporter [Acidobacteriota bacterium]|nr:sodium-dependent transporter [Acidobacteriota bacterium]
MKKTEAFASRWGFIFAGLGMAVGTGNIWRFPRIVAQQGGGAFIIAWLLFLFLWSLPLLTIEISIGKKTRMGVVGSFYKLLGKDFSWMGTFVSFVTTAIMFYYSVVTGWCIKYFLKTLFHGLIKQDSMEFWRSFTSSWEPVFFHFAAMTIGVIIIYAGVVKGIERANKILIPSLFFLLLIACVRSLTLPSAFQGLDFIFSPNFSKLADYKVWLNALSQSAWSSGAGWGLILTYSVYSRKRDNPLLTSSTLVFGDYVASLLAAVAIIPTAFSFFASQEFSQQKVLEVMNADNQGLTFIWIPHLFSKVPMGSFFLPLFFLALSFAAFSSLISMIELVTRILMDTGLSRKKAVFLVGVFGFCLGIPSALSMGFFNNQDWVWGLGLMVSGFFFTILVIKVGPKNFKNNIISSPENKINIGKWFDVLVTIFLPLQFLAMLAWWFWQSYSSDPKNWLNIFSSSSVGTVLIQWITAIVIIILLNKIITKNLKVRDNVN